MTGWEDLCILKCKFRDHIHNLLEANGFRKRSKRVSLYVSVEKNSSNKGFRRRKEVKWW